MKKYKLYLGDNMQSLKKLPDNSIDSIVSDPPYALTPSKGAKAGFMGKLWDAEVPTVEFWKEVYRVLKPGGHILSFGGTRTYHRMVVNIEDAGFEIRDQIMWIYGSGFPKSHNIGKAVDKIQGNEREVVGEYIAPDGRVRKGIKKDIMPNATEWDNEDRIQTKGQSEYEGWGTALKPANEPICLARKPLSEKSVAENVIKWKTGGINIDGCRVGYTNEEDKQATINAKYTTNIEDKQSSEWGTKQIGNVSKEEGRFPANLIFECCCDEVIKGEKGEKSGANNNYGEKNGGQWGQGRQIRGADYNDTGDIHTNPNCPCYMLDQQSGVSKSSKSVMGSANNGNNEGRYNWNNGDKNDFKSERGHNDKGGASRFFYNAKVSKAERNMGLDEFDEKIIEGRDPGQDERSVAYKPRPISQKNTHPTVKPVSLMTYLCRLITPENGIILDPFMGSGSTGIAAQLEGFRFVGMEMDEDYMKIAEARIESYEKYRKFIK